MEIIRLEVATGHPADQNVANGVKSPNPFKKSEIIARSPASNADDGSGDMEVEPAETQKEMCRQLMPNWPSSKSTLKTFRCS